MIDLDTVNRVAVMCEAVTQDWVNQSTVDGDTFAMQAETLIIG
jgi:hypothetical protein